MTEKRPFKEALMNGPGTIISRIFVIIGIPACIGMGAWIGNRLVGQLDHMATLMATQHEDTVKSINVLDVRLSVTERDIKYLSERR